MESTEKELAVLDYETCLMLEMYCPLVIFGVYLGVCLCILNFLFLGYLECT